MKMSKGTSLRLIELIDRSDKEQSLLSTKNLYAHLYFGWKVLNDEFDPTEVTELYWKCWERIITDGFEGAKKALKIEEITDAAKLVRVFKQLTAGIATAVRIVEEKADLGILDVLWCPNPWLGPKDVHGARMQYYKVECELSVRVNNLLVKLAGLSDEFEATQETFMCGRKDDDYCRMIWQRKKDNDSVQSCR